MADELTGLIPLAQAAAQLGWPVHRLRYLVITKQLPAVRDQGGRWLLLPEAVELARKQYVGWVGDGKTGAPSKAAGGQE